LTHHSYSQDEFKKILKNLFAEKKRVKELEKELEGTRIKKKIQSRLAAIPKSSLSEEYVKLKSAYQVKEEENEHLKKQFEKVKPALTKLLTELKKARHELEILKANSNDYESESLRNALREAQQKIQTLEDQESKIHEESALISKEKSEITVLCEKNKVLEEESERLHKIKVNLEEKERQSEKKIEALKLDFEEMRSRQASTQEESQKELQRNETERVHLVERLAEMVLQMQRQSDMIKELQEGVSLSQKKIEAYEQQEKMTDQEVLALKSELAKNAFETSQLQKSAEYQLTAVKNEKEMLEKKLEILEQETLLEKTAVDHTRKELEEKILFLQKNLEETRSQYQSSDLALMREDYEAKLHEAQTTLEEKETSHEAILARSYEKLRELSQRQREMTQEKENLLQKNEENENQLELFKKEHVTLQTSLKNARLHCEEKDAEIRKAQQHLAKKVKESTILRDLAERQKTQLAELQISIDKQSNEIERLQNNLNLQRIHEEKLHAMSKERTQAAENLTKEWQEKFLALQRDWQEKKGELLELQKMRKTYEQMTHTFSSLKHILGSALESPITEEQEQNHSGD
jgi:hypothetical protein